MRRPGIYVPAMIDRHLEDIDSERGTYRLRAADSCVLRDLMAPPGAS